MIVYTRLDEVSFASEGELFQAAVIHESIEKTLCVSRIKVESDLLQILRIGQEIFDLSDL